MDRPSGPLGAATQSTGRGIPETPPQTVVPMRRPVGTPPNALPLATLAGPVPPVPPIPDLRAVPSSSALAAAAPIVPTAPAPPARVVSLFTDALRNALQENEAQAQHAEGGPASNTELKPGVTIDLSREGIRELPEEVVDVIKHELERLALSHNLLTTFPARFAECTSLRYLNVRNNRIEEFPLALCDLKSLEILDLGRNRIHVLPPQIVKLASLKVLSIRKNPIRELPLCLADMASLRVLKLKDNNITFPPPEVLQAPITSPPNENILPGSDVVEMAVTAHIKDYLRRVALNGRGEVDAAGGGDESSEGTETPRWFPIKRVASGRFPIKVTSSDGTDKRSPATMRPPPIPTRSHYRGLSQQSATIRRTNVMPLTIGSINERGRSNSETGMQQIRPDRPESRNRRRAAGSKKSSDLATLEEQAANRLSHYRGLSHGSAMQGPPVAQSPASPPEPYTQRPIYVRRLSILPERMRESKVFDPIMEAAKGILYSVFQIHPMIQMLMSLTNDGSRKRSSLEIVFYNTNSHVQSLEQAIQKHDSPGSEDEYSLYHDSENVHRACQTLVSAYTHVCTLLASNIDTFVDNGDPRYIRTLLVLLYNSIMELRATMSSMVPENRGFKQSATRAAMGVGDTIRPHSRESSVTPTADRYGAGPRTRNGGYTPGLSNLRVATDVAMPSYTNGVARPPPLGSATPRSGESFVSVGSASLARGLPDFTDEDRQFEEVFLSLQRSTELVMRALPGFIGQLTAGLRSVMGQRDRPVPDEIIKAWKLTISRATTAVHQTETLKARMSLIKLKEPGVRTQAAFWNVCNNFFHAWGTFGETMKEAMMKYKIPIPPDARLRFRPIHQAMKETRDAVLKSPWAYFLQNLNGGGGGGILSPLSAQEGQMQVPVTPQSAALGPAVQATVPSTPQSASFSGAFSGNVFERADALMSYGGLSMGHLGHGHGHGHGGMGSRAGTMSGNSSLSSTLSSMQDPMTPATIISPGSSVRLNGRMAF
ncbi:related to adenylate cyclases [Cephalotrichum gorgonifer]|uniref:Related to adenylate cyclases n=1 Tax=Cephalotrichum gorgonifer TaxID=2041049 RepID=A0AAE8N206_9PEZI|nr:related to adenylate cyclases [Cephalotrichum gorgonifer]